MKQRKNNKNQEFINIIDDEFRYRKKETSEKRDQ